LNSQAEVEDVAGSRQSIARNSMLLATGQAVALALGFATTLIVTDRLGRDYGVFIGAQRFVGLFLLLADFGLGTLLVRSVATRRDEAGTLFATTLAIRLVLCGIFAAVVATVSYLIDYLPEHRPLIYAFIGVNVLGVLTGTLTSLFEGLERMGRSALVNVGRATATFALVVSLLLVGAGMVGVALAFVLAGVAQLGIALALARGLPGNPQPAFDIDRVAPMMREALLFVAIGLCFTALRSLDVVMLTRLSSTDEVARYGAALNFVDALLVLPLLVQRALLPAFARLHAAGESEETVRDALQIFSAVLIPSAVGLALLCDQVVALYPSGQFADAAPVLRILAASLIALGPATVCGVYLTGVGRLPAILGTYAVTLPVQVVANLLLIPRWGAVGAAAATFTAHASLSLIFAGLLVTSGIRLPFAAFARHAVASAGMAGVVLLTRSLPLPVPLATGAISYFALLLLISGNRSLERRLLAAAVERWRTRRSR
jgi:O-antigen/teichoic acid export membrane protein